MNRSIIGQSVGLALLAVVAVGCGGPESPAGPSTGVGPTGKRDIVETAAEMGTFATLVDALRAADLTNTLKTRGPYTVFAPTDEAFTKLPPGTLPTLMDRKNKEQLREVLQYHIVPGRLTVTDLRALRVVRTMGGKDLPIVVKDGKVTVGGATVVQPNIDSNNGVIHGIDAVLSPK